MNDIKLYVLTYGNYISIQLRCLYSLSKFINDNIDVCICLNSTGNVTEKIVNCFLPKASKIKLNDYPKYKAMGEMFKFMPFNDNDLIIWFDDDSFCVGDNWIKLIPTIRNPMLYAGKDYWHDCDPIELEYIKTKKWYRNRPLPTGDDNSIGRVRMACGGFLMLGGKFLKEVDWPDKDLSHNGGDALLAHAAYQLGIECTSLKNCGIRVSAAERRGRSELPIWMVKYIKQNFDTQNIL